MSNLVSIEEEEVVQALGVLEEAGILLSLTEVEDDSDSGVYAFSDAGELIADGLLHAVSKVALRVSKFVGEGEVGHEALLFVRDPNYLWLFDVAGKEGVIANLDRQAWGELSKQLFCPQVVLVDDLQTSETLLEGADLQEMDELRGAATVMQSDLNVQVERCPNEGLFY